MFLWKRRPHFPSPTKLQGAQVPVGGAQGAARELGNGRVPRSSEDRFTGRCRPPAQDPLQLRGCVLGSLGSP